MMISWKDFRGVRQDGEYLALLTFIRLKSVWMMPAFLLSGLHIQRQLSKSPGLIGYSFAGYLRRREFWTLSVWEDEKSLADFTEAPPHSTTMSGFLRHRNASNFVRWRISGSEVPPKWADARKRGLAQAAK
jgi:hypothetical protein